MKKIFKNIKWDQEFDRAKVLMHIHMYIYFLALINLYLQGVESFTWFTGKFLFGILFYRGYLKTFNNLYYTFWSFTLILSIYLIYNILSVSTSGAVYYLNILALIILAIKSYIISSPIFYPRVRWWEYDFRYRADLKIKVNVQEKFYRGRMTDLRRQAACVVLFEDLPIGSVLNIHTDDKNDFDLELKGEVISKREYSLGRGTTYGVRFSFEGKSELRRFSEFTRFWALNRAVRVRSKFADKVSE